MRERSMSLSGLPQFDEPLTDPHGEASPEIPESGCSPWSTWVDEHQGPASRDVVRNTAGGKWNTIDHERPFQEHSR